MRIRNKLVTVQIIMTVTLLISIILFTFHMEKSIRIENTKIAINQLDSHISRFSIYTNAVINKRLPAFYLNQELENKFELHKEYLDKLQYSSLFNTSSIRDVVKDLRLAYIQVNTKSLILVIGVLEATTDVTTNDLIKKMGVRKSIELLRTQPDKVGLTQEEIDQTLGHLNKIYLSHRNLIDEYVKYESTWVYSKDILLSRLNVIRFRSILSTAIFLIITLIIAFVLNYRITNKITVNLNEVNKTLSLMTQGDFTSNLHIAAGDEFGDLSRNFNQFIEDLWKKLDSMNVIMHDIGNAMNEDLNLSKIQGNILTNVTNHIITDSSALFSFKNNVLKISANKGHFPPFYPIEEDLSNDRPRAARYLYEHEIPLDIPIIQECLYTKKPIIVRECFNDERFPQCKKANSALYIGSLMLVPLLNAGEVIGLFVVMRTLNKKPFSDLDFSNFSSFSDYAALTIDTLEKYNELLEKFEMQKEIGVAADIQKSLIPGKMPKIDGITSSAYTLAAKGVSGDYYDFFRMNKYTIGATVCDVAGKGVPASLVMVMIRTILRLVSSPSRGAAETLTMLNRSISGKIDVDRYATMAFFKIDLKNMKLNYSNAAHHPIQIFRQKTQKFYAVDSPGLPIGIDRDSQFKEKRISIYPGDIIFMYTDGFPEARNHQGDEYSTSRMLREIRLHCNSSAPEILDSIIEDMHKFTARASQHDDQTILIIKIDEEK